MVRGTLLGVASVLAACAAPAPAPTSPEPPSRPAPVSRPPARGQPSDALVPRALLVGAPTHHAPALAPDGAHLAYLAGGNDGLEIWLAPLADLGAARPITAGARAVDGLAWSPDGRHLLYRAPVGGALHVMSLQVPSGVPRGVPVAAAIDAAEGRPVDLGRADGSARVVAIGARDAIVAIEDADAADLYRVALGGGAAVRVQQNRRFDAFALDAQHRVVAAVVHGEAGSTLVRQGRDGRWRPLVRADQRVEIALVGVDDQGHLVILERRAAAPRALVALEPASGVATDLARDPRLDVVEVFWDDRLRRARAVAFGPERAWRPVETELASDLEAVNRLGARVHILDATDDDSTWLLAIDDPAQPRRWVLWARATQTARPLWPRRAIPAGAALARVRAVSIGGERAHLSVPSAGADGPAGLVVLLRDGSATGLALDRAEQTAHWSLTSRGYAVLSIAAEPGALARVRRWATENRISSADRLCVIGPAALVAHAEGVACAVALAGVSGIAAWDRERPAGPRPATQRTSRRPVPAVLLVGTRRAGDPVARSLDARGAEFAYAALPEPGDFTRPADAIAYFGLVEAFLSAHLGGPYEPLADEALRGAALRVLHGGAHIPGIESRAP